MFKEVLAFLKGQVINVGCTTTKLTIYLPLYQLNKKRKSMLFFNDYKKKIYFFTTLKVRLDTAYFAENWKLKIL